MRLTETIIKDLYQVQFPVHVDKRGGFIKTFEANLFKEAGLFLSFQEHYFSTSQKNVIRGMHFQTPPDDHVKLVSVSSGAILDVVIDLRPHSPTFQSVFSIEIEQDSGLSLILPKGVAHGFKSLCDQSIVNYAQTTVYSPTCDAGIRFDSFGFNWECDTPILSDRDLSFPTLESFFEENPFQ